MSEQANLSAGNQADLSASGDAPVSTPPTQTQAAAPTRPDWISDKFWDAASGVKLDDLGAEFKTLEAFKADADARAAQVPLSADAYATALPEDFKLPDGWSIDEADPTWKAGKEYAKANGLSQAQFSGLAKIYVEGQISAHQREETALAAQLKARDDALGANGAARVDALNTWFKATAANDRVARQLAQTLWTPDIISHFEKIQQALTNQGVAGFRQDGRTQGRTDGKPEGWEQMSALDQRTYLLSQG